MPESPDRNRHGRRTLLRAGVGAAAAALAAPASAEDPAPPAGPEWSQSLGPGVGDQPYGQPSKYESDVIRRIVPWLTASPESSVSFSSLQDLNGIITPNGLFFERYHAGRPTVEQSHEQESAWREMVIR